MDSTFCAHARYPVNGRSDCGAAAMWRNLWFRAERQARDAEVQDAGWAGPGPEQASCTGQTPPPTGPAGGAPPNPIAQPRMSEPDHVGRIGDIGQGKAVASEPVAFGQGAVD